MLPVGRIVQGRRSQGAYNADADHGCVSRDAADLRSNVGRSEGSPVGINLFGPRPPSTELVAWMRDPGVQKGVTLSLQSWRRDHRPATMGQNEWKRAAEAQFFQAIEDAVRGAGEPAAAVDSEVDAGREYEINGPGATLDRYIHSLAIQVPIRLALCGLSIRQLYVVAGPGVTLQATNCNIAHLWLNAQNASAQLRLDQSNLGTLQLVPGSLSHFEMRGGSLLNVTCPPPNGGNPFTGTVSFTNDVFFPRRRNIYILPGPQPYRNMRYHLRSLENAQMANLIHSAELAVEREDDSRMNRILSHLYEWMSDFGSSALRPLVWQGVLFVLSFSLILCSDGAVHTSQDPKSELLGWQQALIDPRWGACVRAAYLALQPLVNPIGIFGPRSLLVPRFLWLTVWLSVAGILGIVLLALFIFAIRRRFKIQM
jgi:hypothetical protein